MTNATLLRPEAFQQALALLAGVCDGAEERDGAGFSQADVWHGHYLAHAPLDTWGDEGGKVAHFLARKYARQLERLDCPYVFPPLTDADLRPADEWDTVRGQARDAREAGRRIAFEKEDAKRRAAALAALTPEERARKAGGLTLEHGLLALYAPYDAARVEVARSIAGRRFSRDPEPHDTFPLSSLSAALALCARFGLLVHLDVEAVSAQAEVAAQEAATSPNVSILGTTNGRRTLHVEFDYDPQLLRAFKADLSEYSPRYSAHPAPHWQITVHFTELPEAVRLLSHLGLKLSDELLALAEQSEAEGPARARLEAERLARAQSRAKAIEAPALPTPGVTTALMPHQYVPLHGVAEYGSVLIADAPGLGKTLESIAILAHLPPARTLIICPSNLTSNWVSEFAQHAPGYATVHVCESQQPQPIPEHAGVLVIGWAIVSHWAEALIRWAPQTVIVDEAHYGKSGADLSGSARGKSVLRLCEAARQQGGRVLPLTGTPIVNRPKELLPLLEMMGVLDEFGGAWGYKMRYCGAVQKDVPGQGLKWSFEGASNTQELHQRLVDSGRYIRRTKQMLVQAGVMGRKTINGADAYDYEAPRTPVFLTLTPDERAEYTRAVAQFKTWVVELAQAEAAREGRQLTEELMGQIIRRKTSSILPQIGAVRALLGRLKMPHVRAHVETLHRAGEQTVIVAHHREVVDAYAKAYTGLKIQGGMGVPKVEEVKRQFNTSDVKKHPALVLAIESGKTGHTLCLQRKNGAGPECAYMIFAEEGYVPGDEEQAQDRIWRIGQSREVIISNLLAKNTLDEGLYALRASKRGATTSVIDGVGDVDDASVVSYLTEWLMND